MDVEELMIGDLVRSRLLNKIVRVTGIHDGLVDTNCISPLKGDEIEPISLTEEILLNNGFKSNIGPGGLFQLQVKGVCINIDFNIIRYVHELQHAMKLCGRNKNIKL